MDDGTRTKTRNQQITLFAVLITLLIYPLPMAAQNETGSAAPGSDERATHEVLRALRREVETAFNAAGRSGKLEDFRKVLVYVDDNVVLAGMNGDLVVGKDKLVDYFNAKMMAPSRTIKSIHHGFEPGGLTILHGGDAGVAYGTSTGRYELTGGLSFEVNTIWTATLVKKGGKWLIASFQFGPSIFDNPLMDKAAQSLYWGVGIAGLVGLLMGFLLGRWVRRTKPAAGN